MNILSKLPFIGLLGGAILLTPLLLSGCVLNKQPEYESAAVTAVCAAKDGETVSVSFLGETKTVSVHIASSWDELYTHCGKTGGACVYLPSNRIYMIDDRRCPQHASHELAHVFGVPGIDAVHQVVQRRNDFMRR